MKNIGQVTNRRQNYATYILVVCAFLLALVVSVMATIAYFVDQDTAGGSTTFANLELVTNVTSFGDDNVLISDNTYSNMPATITVAEDSIDAFVRAKCEILVDGEAADGEVIANVLFQEVVESELVTRWIYSSTDGFWYYVGVINSTTSCTFISGYTTHNVENKNVKINITAEGIQKDYEAYKSVWTTAPSDWVLAIASL